MLRLDHVVYAVRDLDQAASRFREEFGLDSSIGGRHQGWGTANRIVPLGDQYVELIGVVDADEAARTVFGRQVLERVEDGDGWFAIVAAADDVGAEADRLNLPVHAGSRERLDGEVVRWRMAGLEDPVREPWMPFFITWDVPAELHPGRVRAGHGVRAEAIAWVEIGGDEARLREWLGGEELPIRVGSEAPGIGRVAIATAGGGELVIE
ncbi:MAG: VOC family protein [Actinobacteria bacterium]|nr:VOC family protein [Actinomycetota bacterium]